MNWALRVSASYCGLMLASCSPGIHANSASTNGSTTQVAVLSSPAVVSRDTHERLTGALWAQTSAEYRVDSLAKYRQALLTLQKATADKSWTAALEQTGDPSGLKQTAVIMDLDETVLDNSRFQAELALQRAPYLDSVWADWVKLEDAGSIPGAVDFIKAAEALGVTIFFVTNRTTAEEQDTRNNLAKLGLTLPTTVDTVLTKNEKPAWGSDKGTRRAEIAASYRILLLIGDDLGDFATGAKDTPANRVALADKYATYFGERWVLIANPLYGSWESALYNHDFTKPDSEVLKLKFDQLKGFK